MKPITLTFCVLCIFGLTACQTNNTLMKDMGGLLSQASSLLSSTSQNGSGVSSLDIVSAFKQALSIGSNNVVSKLGSAGGFSLDPKIHIPLPGMLGKVQSNMRKIGLSAPLDNLEIKLNQAAEAATPYAKKIFLNAISQLTFDDVMKIYNGPNDAATQYFKEKTSASLATKMQPIINQAVAQTGVIQAYERATQGFDAVPPFPDPRTSLTHYVTNKSLDAVFLYLAQEEAAIRQDPVRQTTALLKKVFGTNAR